MPLPRPYPAGVGAPRAATPSRAAITGESLVSWSAGALSLVHSGAAEPDDATAGRGDDTLERLTGVSDWPAVAQVDGTVHDPSPNPNPDGKDVPASS